ncbi:MAG: hypothetical protein CM1200mP2_41950 [Planctomycetaceae bacterium]|nr:MAG: hypothetical protein CM1200mP2_41950 [Planctomycetaceae bacterium]
MGPVAFRHAADQPFLGKEYREQREFSEETAHVIDQEVQDSSSRIETAFDMLQRSEINWTCWPIRCPNARNLAARTWWIWGAPPPVPKVLQVKRLWPRARSNR